MSHMGSYSYYPQECQGGRPVLVFLEGYCYGQEMGACALSSILLSGH